MQLLFAFICDYADAVGGKINALGIGFNTIYAQNVPTTHRQFYFVAKLQADITEAGEKDLRINLIDEDGVDVIKPLERKLSIPKPRTGTVTSANLTVAFDNVKFQKYGDYALHFLLQGVTQTIIRLAVSPPPTK